MSHLNIFIMAVKTITINGKEYRVKQTIRAIFIWEQITGRVFEIQSSLDNMVYLFALLMASNEDFDLSWDQFIDAVDANPLLAGEIQTLINEQIAETARLFPSKEEADGKKKD